MDQSVCLISQRMFGVLLLLAAGVTAFVPSAPRPLLTKPAAVRAASMEAARTAAGFVSKGLGAEGTKAVTPAASKRRTPNIRWLMRHTDWSMQPDGRWRLFLLCRTS